MTETTEGLTRRTSSGSDSSAAGAGAAKPMPARSRPRYCKAERAARLKGGRPSRSPSRAAWRANPLVLSADSRSHVARDDEVARGRVAFGLERDEEAEVRERRLGLDL